MRDYLRLLPSAPGTVAELAAGQVRQAMPLDPADLVEAVEALTFRAEAKLAATGLRWIDQSIKPAPETAADLLPALTTAYAHSSFDVRNRAAELTLKHAGPFAAHAQAILDALLTWARELGRRWPRGSAGRPRPRSRRSARSSRRCPTCPRSDGFPSRRSLPATTCGGSAGSAGWRRSWRGRPTTSAKVRREVRPPLEQASSWWRSVEARTDVDEWRVALADAVTDPGPGGLPDLPPREPGTVWVHCRSSHVLRQVTRGEPVPREAMPVPKARRSDYVYADDVTPGPSSSPGPPTRARPGPSPPRTGARCPSSTAGSWRGPGSTRWRTSTPSPTSCCGSVSTPDRADAMRRSQPVPPPGPDEPLVAVTIFHTLGHRRVVRPEPLSAAEESRRRHRLPAPEKVPPPYEFLIHRHHELLTALRAGTLPPVLLATPTWLDGHLDPDVLVTRLETCAAAGVEPLPADLAQALMRLPRGGDPAAAERAAAVDSDAARSAARWLAGEGLPDPETTFTWTHRTGGQWVELGDDEPADFTAARLVPCHHGTADRPSADRRDAAA